MLTVLRIHPLLPSGGIALFPLTCFGDIINKFTEMVLQNGSDFSPSMEQGAKRVRIFCSMLHAPCGEQSEPDP
jgi:hypothetical protein